jgi:hypothetical protein
MLILNQSIHIPTSLLKEPWKKFNFIKLEWKKFRPQ